VARAFVIGLGGNLGDRVGYLTRGVEAVARLQVEVEAVSRVFESDAIGPPQPAYLNAALRVSATALDAEALLIELLAIEAAVGRVREVRWGPRVLDLDILWSTQPHVSERLIVPHRELQARTFALAPLLDVAPELAPQYAHALDTLGGPPHVCGALRWDRTARVCEYSAVGRL
jgi:2-amino-4-hydroxy-6-hydroxymethyldihydropteridine diphosphokinase